MTSRAEQDSVDVLVIGAGPIGLACGVEAGRRGLRCRIVEKGCLGVVCGGMETSKWFIENSREHPGRIFDRIGTQYINGRA
jgi:thioredoxin reductase